jgi:hypothetical protein
MRKIVWFDKVLERKRWKISKGKRSVKGWCGLGELGL